MKKRWKKWKRCINSIQVKVLLLIIILILPLNVIAILESYRVIDNTVEQAKEKEQSLVDLYMTDLSTSMYEANYLLLYFMSSDANCIEMVQQRDDNYQYAAAKMKFLATLKTIVSITNASDGYFYCMLKNDDQLIYGPSKQTKDMHAFTQEQMLLLDNNSKEATLGWHLYEVGETQYLVYLLQSNQVLYGVWIDMDEKKQDLSKKIGYEEIQMEFSESEILDIPNNIIYISASAKKIYLNLLLNEREIVRGVSIYLRLTQFFVIVYLILIPILYLLIKSLLLNPLGVINKAHEQIECGNHHYRIIEQSNSIEYDTVFKSFNRMVDQLDRYKIESYEKELEKQKMELRNLQLQIRPHFLLNTFNLVFTMAQKNDNASIQSIILYLSDYFRFIFRSEKEMELFTKEMELIRGYIQVLSIRYNGQIEFDDDIDPELMMVRMPPLLIHNFIENAVKHGKKDGEILHISLRAAYEQGWVTFTIVDDGNGMSTDMLRKNQEILMGERPPQKKNMHIGLYNSFKRLKYFYGESATIEVESELGNMTAFTIRFPYDVEVDDEPFIDQ